MDVKITIMGSDYAGLVIGAYAAELGNHVICHDNDILKIQALRRCKLPFIAPELQNTMARNKGAGRLMFTHDAIQSIAHGELIFIAKGHCDAAYDASGSGHVSRTLKNISRWGHPLKIVIVSHATNPVAAPYVPDLSAPSRHSLDGDLGAQTLHQFEHGLRHPTRVRRCTQQGVL